MAQAGPIDGDPNCLARHAYFGVVLSWWRQLRDEGGRPPNRREIDPIALKAALSHLLIGEFHADADRLRLRLVGTAINEMYEMGELTGRFLDEITIPSDHRAILDRVALVLRTQMPDCRTRVVTRPSDHHLVSWDRLVVPLEPLPGEPAMVLAAIGPMTVRKPHRRGPG